MTDQDHRTIAVCQGELAVSADSGIVLSAILGSCVATCLWDPDARVGGMNHILLPGDRAGSRVGNKYGVYAMEALINEILKIGGRKPNLVAKIFGGAVTFENGLRIGDSNVQFVQGFLRAEGIPIRAQSLGGSQARRVRFFPESGRAQQLLSGDPECGLGPPRGAGSRFRKTAIPDQGAGRVELFLDPPA